MEYNVDIILSVLELCDIIRDALIPFAIVLLAVGIIKDTYDYFLSKEKIEIGEDTAQAYLIAITKSNLLPFFIFLGFTKIALFPLYIVDQITSELREIDPVTKMYERKLAPSEQMLRDLGYLDSENEGVWNNASIQSKIGFIRELKAKQEAIDNRDSDYESDYFEDGDDDDVNGNEVPSYLEDRGDDEFSISDMLTMDFMESLTVILVIVINYIRSGIEYLVGQLFTFLLLADYLWGIFAAFMSIFAWSRSHFLNWIIENFSLLFWMIAFMVIDWIMSLVSLSTMSDSGNLGMSSWTIPLLSMITLGGVAGFAAKMVGGREAGAGTLQSAVKTGLNAIPFAASALGGVMTKAGSAAKGFAGSQAGSALRGFASMAIGGKRDSPVHKALSGTAGAINAVSQGVANAKQYFSPEPQLTPEERTASAVEELTQKF